MIFGKPMKMLGIEVKKIVTGPGDQSAFASCSPQKGMKMNAWFSALSSGNI
jgi:hypothetical protein